jgi:hypothetical protein
LEWFARALLPPAFLSLVAAAAMASPFFSEEVWCALGLQLPLVPRAFPATGSYPGQHCDFSLAGDFFAFPWPVELGLLECLSVQACPCAVFRPVFCAVPVEPDALFRLFAPVLRVRDLVLAGLRVLVLLLELLPVRVLEFFARVLFFAVAMVCLR